MVDGHRAGQELGEARNELVRTGHKSARGSCGVHNEIVREHLAHRRPVLGVHVFSWAGGWTGLRDKSELAPRQSALETHVRGSGASRAPNPKGLE